VFYDYLLAYFPARVRLILNEKAIPYIHKQINILNGESLSPSFLALNPNASLPVLQHNEKTLLQSLDICEYLNEFDGKPLGTGNDKKLVENWVQTLARWDGNLYMDTKTSPAAKWIMKTLNDYKIGFCLYRAKKVISILSL
jgi:glutathione S-transferase